MTDVCVKRVLLLYTNLLAGFDIDRTTRVFFYCCSHEFTVVVVYYGLYWYTRIV